MPYEKVAVDPELLSFARRLRQDASDAESFLWALLRGRRRDGCKFRRQHPVGPFVLDFYCEQARLAIECDGGQHNTDEARRHDERRTLLLAERGIRVLRFWNHEVFEDSEAVLEAIYAALVASPSLTPGPSPTGRGETNPAPSPCGRGLG
ncbi:MAG: endonuclease domain-containing protein [Pirellulales bacterium]